MAEKKKTREERGRNKRKPFPARTLTVENKRPRKKGRKEDNTRRKIGPRLPSALRKELGFTNRDPGNQEDEVDSEGGEGDREELYEYEEEVPQEETKKNRRFDPVDNLEYELPEEFEDEDVPSDDDIGSDKDLADQSDGSEEGGDRYLRMLQGITGLPGQAFEGKKKREIVSDIPTSDGANGPISIHDLLDPLQDRPEYSKLRKKLEKLERKPMTVRPPLPKVERERLERKVAYEHSKKDMTKWEPLVKRNREAPTIYFEEDVDVGYSTVGAIAAEFKPRTEFEKKMALLVHDPEVVDAHMKDGSRLLELNKISVNDVRDRQNRLAKMRSLLFRHELKAKRIKKIKSKTYHRFLRKDKLKAAPSEMQVDPEALKEQAMKQEFKRAEERMTLKHKNSSQWAKRIIKRGLQVQDENTKAAMSEQLHQHALLTRKMNSMKDNTSSDDDSDDDDDDDCGELSPRADSERMSKILERAKEKTLSLIEEDDEMPKSGVLSLPFMVRGLKKKMEAAHEEAQVTLEEYDSCLRQIDDLNEEKGPQIHRSSGRMVFGAARKESQESRNRIESDNIGKRSDSEDEFEIKANVDAMHEENNQSREVQLGPGPLFKESDTDQDTFFQTIDDVNKDPGPKTTHDVAIFASGSWKKRKDENDANSTPVNSAKDADPTLFLKDHKTADQYSDTDSDHEMVDGILSLDTKPDYELPSQDDLIHRAFAGDDVEGEFEKDKLEVLDEENPEPEKPVLLPGWGQWTHVQQKKGLPSWMVKEYEDAKRKREEALKKRKDSYLKNVIISEKIDKKAEKLHTKSLPYPFTSKEVFEQSIRMPIGPDYNPALTVGALNRPAVVKKAGVIIKPIKFQEVDPYDKANEPNRSKPKPKTKKTKFTGRRTPKKASTGRKM